MHRKNRNIHVEPGLQASCLDCDLRQINEWCVLSSEQVLLLDENKDMMTYFPGDIIFHQGNPSTGIYSVRSGTVALRQTDSQGHAIMIKMVQAGQPLGYADYFAGQNYTFSAEALENCSLCHINKLVLAQLLNENTQLAQQFLTRIARDLNRTKSAMIEQVYQPVRMRMARLLVSLKESFGTVNDKGVIEITPPLSRQDMADLLATRPETLARTIHALEEDGVITHQGRTMSIPDLDILLDEISSE